jgi:pimeloyl-ACP methyl ester carboxylesterase
MDGGPVMVAQESIELRVGGQPLQIATCRDGKGQIVLLLHGWGHTKEIWQDVIPLISSGSVEALAVDLPGFGNSPSPPVALQTIPGYTAVLLELIASLQARATIHAIVADSLAARIVYNLLLSDFPISCSRFLLSGCPFDGLPFALNLVQLTNLPGPLIAIIQTFPRGIARSIIRSLSWYTISNTDIDMAPIYDGILHCHPMTAGRLLHALATCAEVPQNTQFTGLNIVLLRGQNDRVVPQESYTKWSERLASEEVILPNVGHTPMLEAPSAFAETINRLII